VGGLLLVRTFFYVSLCAVAIYAVTMSLLGLSEHGGLLEYRYHRPVAEDRIFMFLDLNDSTAIAAALGPLRFNDFKNDFFHDIAEPVLETRSVSTA
jgi:adenylate cyclase